MSIDYYPLAKVTSILKAAIIHSQMVFRCV